MRNKILIVDDVTDIVSMLKDYFELSLLRKVNNYFYLFYFLSQNIFAYHK